MAFCLHEISRRLPSRLWIFPVMHPYLVFMLSMMFDRTPSDARLTLLPVDALRVVGSYLSIEEKLTYIRDLLPRVLGADLISSLQVDGGFATTRDAVDDFYSMNLPELVPDDQPYLDPFTSSEFSRIRQVAIDYLQLKRFPLRQYLPLGLRVMYGELFTPGPRFTVQFGTLTDLIGMTPFPLGTFLILHSLKTSRMLGVSKMDYL